MDVLWQEAYNLIYRNKKKQKYMDFLDPAKKRAHQRRLFTGYLLVGVAILLGSTILVLQSYGFDVNHKTGQVIQNGLIFTASAPESSTIYLNGKENGTTDKRLTVPAGDYTVELKRDGYQTWKRSFTLAGSSIERLVYPVLFPSKLKTVERHTFKAAPSFTSQSLDRRWIISERADAITTFDVFDANDTKAPATSFTLPADVMTTSALPQSLSLVEWSTDNKHLLVKHTFGDAHEFIVININASVTSVNVNKTLSITPTLVTLRDKKPDQLYLYDGPTKVLKSADLKSKLQTEVLRDVISYKSYGDKRILYAVTDATDATKANIVLKDGKKKTVLKRSVQSSSYLLDLAEYDSHWYVAVGVVDDKKVYIFRDPEVLPPTSSKVSSSIYSVLSMEKPTQVVFSANTRFLMTQSGNKFAVYDAELNKRYSYQTPFAIPADTKASWMDGHRIVVNANSKTNVFDYDGINQHQLAPISAGIIPMFDRDYTRLYSITPSSTTPAKTVLTRTDLKLNLN